MKTINLYLKSSDTKKCTYYIYRDTDPSKLPADVLALSKLTPIVTINESTYPNSRVLLYTDDMLVDKTQVPTDKLIPFAFTTVPLIEDVHNLIINVSRLNGSGITENLTLTVYFDSSKNVTRLIYIDAAGVSSTFAIADDISKYIEVRDTYVYIARDIVQNYVSVQATYYVSMVKVTDTYDDSKSTPPTGLNTPIIDAVVSSKSISIATIINYLEFTPSIPNTGINYYYRVLAYDSSYGYSLPSKLMAANLTQLASDITFSLQSSSDYDPATKTGTFANVVSGIKNGTSIQVGNPTSTDFSTYGNPFIENIPVFNPTDINTIDASIDNGILVLNIPNVWQNGNPAYNSRNYKAFRVIASLPNGTTSSPSAVYHNTEKVNLPIEKMILIREDVTGFSSTVPTSPDNPKGSLMCTWIRKNGVYYNVSKHGTYPYNVQDATKDIQIMSENSLFPTLNITDKTVIKGKTYMYTIYLYDCFKRISNPICLIKNF